MSTALVVLCVAAGIVQEAAASPRSTGAATTASGRALRLLALVASLLLLGATVLAVLGTDSILLATLGGTMVIGGGWLRAAAMRSLGPQFRTEGGASELVTVGIHGVMRHPSELGLLAWSLGLFVAAPGALAGVFALAQLPLLVMRLRIEESQLAAGFGARWLHYASTTPPFGV